MLGEGTAPAFARTRLAGHWIYADKCNQRLLASETPNVTDLRHELRTCRFTDAIHGHDGVKFRQLAGKAQHPGTNGLNSSGNCEKLCGSFLYQQLRGLGPAYEGNNFSGTCVDLRSLVRIEVVAVTLAPLAVALDKGCTTDGGDAFGVPEGCNKVHPFLTAGFASGTVEPAIHSRKGAYFKLYYSRSLGKQLWIGHAGVAGVNGGAAP